MEIVLPNDPVALAYALRRLAYEAACETSKITISSSEAVRIAQAVEELLHHLEEKKNEVY